MTQPTQLQKSEVSVLRILAARQYQMQGPEQTLLAARFEGVEKGKLKFTSCHEDYPITAHLSPQMATQMISTQPPKQDEVDVQQPLFNHAFDFAFEINSHDKDAEDVTADMIRRAMIERLMSLDDAELVQACGWLDMSERVE
ncbi:hypothetical protein [Alteromonas macleodii]|uniref:Uncharacterized protein n=1 Tax=Alteromonas macleodii TaxID=28108 RepID=A0AB36FML0_ALTMA|nr:hypothetical protein [Alteromonas macleodii]OES24041.1 hypothetical protein BFV95_4880 [Alteromonas macleodii]OES25370.1 hypothetical protein BFV93_4474 [Alteromonas macleodii]OES25719.1 hypothetical protein BFV94_4326 [Alteromonas macleodii]OES38603.1 hypothetical protein BFV96_4714 [Alteromonas macleodii]